MIQFIINPTAGNGRAAASEPLIRSVMDATGVAYGVVETAGVDHATELAREAVDAGASAVVAVGGDGTLLEAAFGLLETRVPLGVVPLGNGNDFSRGLNKLRGLNPPKKWEDSTAWHVRRILDCPPQPMDVIRAGNFISLNISGVGLDSDIAREAAHLKKTFGQFSYIISTIKNAVSFRPFTARLVCDGQEQSGKFTLLSVCNGQYYGGGFRIAPMADMRDGKMTVCVVRAMPTAKILALFPSVLLGRHLGIKQVSFIECDAAEIHYDGVMRANFDGNIFPLPSPLRYELLRGAILVF